MNEVVINLGDDRTVRLHTNPVTHQILVTADIYPDDGFYTLADLKRLRDGLTQMLKKMGLK